MKGEHSGSDPRGRVALLGRLEPAPPTAVVLTGGGLSSTVVAYWLSRSEARPTLLTCTTKSQADRGLECAEATAVALEVEHRVVDLSNMARALSSGPADTSTPHNMLTAVSNAMAIVLDLGVALAINRRVQAVQVGVHVDDASMRPECDAPFLAAVAHQAVTGNTELIAARFRVHGPLIGLTGYEVVLLGQEVGVPFQDTWSCVRAGPVHCGNCTGCRARRGAFTAAGLTDPAI